MFKMLGKYRIAIATALLLTLIELFVELIQPYLISKIIDEGIVAKQLSVVWLWGGILLLCTVAAFVAGVVNSFYSSHVSQSFGFDVRERLYEKVQSFSFSVFNRIPASSLITRLTNDVSQIQNTIFMGLRIMIRAPLLVIGGVVMALLVKASLAAYLLMSVPVLVVFLLWILKKAGALFRSVQEQLDGVNGVMRENLIGIRLVRAFVRSDQEEERFNRSSASLAERTKFALRITETTMPGILFVMNLGIMAVLWFGSKQIQSGDSTVGEIVAIVNYAMRMTGALSIMSMIIMGYSRAKASAVRINEVLMTEAGVNDVSDTDSACKVTEGRITFESVTFRYPESQVFALADIGFEVKSGETIAVLGATGSGKSTLFQLIPRLYEQSQGSIRIDGADIRDMPLERLRKQIGFVPQESMLFTGSIKENIAWGNEHATSDDIMDAAKRAQIHDTIKKMPQGYDSVLGQRGVNLSGGQKQRISIARALVRKPAILLLDDSTSALDVQTEAKLLQALKSNPCTTLIITQKISTTMKADTIILLEEGRLIAKGTHLDLLSNCPLYRQICRSQFGEEATAFV